jgi:PAS domain S-box-containing protein
VYAIAQRFGTKISVNIAARLPYPFSPRVIDSSQATRSQPATRDIDPRDCTRAALASAPVLQLEITPSGQLTAWHGGGAAALQTPAHLLIGRSIYDTHASEPWLVDGFERARAGQPSTNSGHLEGRTFQCHWSVIRNDHGGVERVIALAIDVTPHVRAQRLQRAEAEIFSRVAADGKLTDILNALCSAMEADHPNARASIRMLNKDGSRLLLAAAPSLNEDFHSSTQALIVGPEGGSSGSAAALGRPVVTTDTATDPLWIRLRDVALRHQLHACWSMPIKNSAGAVVGTFAIFPSAARGPDHEEVAAIERAADIAAIAIERHATHAALARSEAEHRALVDSLKQVVFRVDLLGCWTFLSQAWLPLTGKRIDDSLGQPLIDFVHPDDRQSAVDFLQCLAITPDKPQDTELRFISPGGEVRRVELRATAQRDDFGQFAGATGTLADVTEARLMRAQLMTADRMASVGLLAAGVAHEINKPLAAIVANVEYVRAALSPGWSPPAGMSAGEQADEVTSSLEDASEAARRVRDIVHDLRVLSRVDGREKRVVDVQRTMEGTVRIAWNEIRHRARLVRDYRAILLVNAAQAITAGNADQHEIRVATFTDSSGRAVIEVQDTGMGMPPEVVRGLFEPFFTTKPVGVGTGLGLAICRRIVTSLGGTIEVRSQVGKGSVFQVVLPSAIGVAPDVDEPPVMISQSVAPNGRILLIDDDEAVIAAVRRALRAGDITTLTSAADALELLRAGAKYDAIISDMMMPNMSGQDFYEGAMAVDPQQAARIVFLSGGAFTDGAQSFLDRVPNPHIDKPFDPAALRALIRQTIGDRGEAPDA